MLSANGFPPRKLELDGTHTGTSGSTKNGGKCLGRRAHWCHASTHPSPQCCTFGKRKHGPHWPTDPLTHCSTVSLKRRGSGRRAVRRNAATVHRSRSRFGPPPLDPPISRSRSAKLVRAPAESSMVCSRRSLTRVGFWARVGFWRKNMPCGTRRGSEANSETW